MNCRTETKKNDGRIDGKISKKVTLIIDNTGAYSKPN